MRKSNRPYALAAFVGLACAVVAFALSGQYEQKGSGKAERSEESRRRTPTLRGNVTVERAERRTSDAPIRAPAARLRLVAVQTGRAVRDGRIVLLPSRDVEVLEERVILNRASASGVFDLTRAEVSLVRRTLSEGGVVYASAPSCLAGTVTGDQLEDGHARDGPLVWIVRLEEPNAVAGVLVDPWGVGIAGGQVVGGAEFLEDLLVDTSLEAGPAVAQPLVRTTSDAEGWYRLEGVRAYPLTLLARAPGYARSWPVDCRGDSAPEIRLHPVVWASAKILDEVTGRPVTAANVQFEPLPPGFKPYRPDEFSVAMGAVDEVGFGAGGLLHAGAVAESVDRTEWEHGGWQVALSITAPGFDARHVRLSLRKLGELGYQVPEPVRLRRSGAALGELELRLLPDGAGGASWAWLRLRERGGAEWRFRANFEAGAARILLPVGTYDVVMLRDPSVIFPTARPGEEPSASEVQVAARGIARAELRREASDVELRVVCDTGLPCRGAIVDLYRMPTGGMIGTVPLFRLARSPEYADARKRFPATAGVLRTTLRPGKYMAVARHPLFAAVTTNFDVAEGSVTRASLRLSSRP